MFNMEVSKYDDPLQLLERYRLSWVCDGNKVTYSFVITKEMIWETFYANEVIAQTLTHYMDTAVLDRHGETKCEWCTAAQHSLRVFIKSTNAGMTVPKPFWKQKYHAGGLISTGQPYPEYSLGNPATSVAETMAAKQEAMMLAEKSTELPGVSTWVKYPCECSGQERIRGIIMHLNDAHRWTREAIADWLTEIDDPYGDGPDLAFKVPE